MLLALVAFPWAHTWAAGKPLNPFGGRRKPRYTYKGVFHMSDGTKIEALCRLRGRKVFRIYDRVNMRNREFTLPQVEEIACEVVKKWQEKIWRWKEGGQHVKIDTGQSYPICKFVHKMKLRPDEDEEDEPPPVVEGGMSGVIFYKLPGQKEKKFWFHETWGDKGMIGKGFEDMVYVKRMVFAPLEADKK